MKLKTQPSKELSALLRRARAAGWSTTKARKHWRLAAPDGIGLIYCSATPSDRRAIKNLRALLRQRGLKL